MLPTADFCRQLAAVVDAIRTPIGTPRAIIQSTAWLAMHGALAIIVSCPGYELKDPTELVGRMVDFVLRAVRQEGPAHAV